MGTVTPAPVRPIAATPRFRLPSQGTPLIAGDELLLRSVEVRRGADEVIPAQGSQGCDRGSSRRRLIMVLPVPDPPLGRTNTAGRCPRL